MNKKLTLLSLAVISVLAMSSCRKDRTCTCTKSSNGGSVTTSTIIVKKSTKKAAAGGSCWSGTLTQTSGSSTSVSTQDCVIK